MAKYTLSLNKKIKGQIVIESLFVITFLLGFLIVLQNFYVTAQKEIQKERLSKKIKNKQAPWVKNLKKEKNE